MSDQKGALIRILSAPIYPHELAEPTEAVADYLIDNDVFPVVRCKGCSHSHYLSGAKKYACRHPLYTGGNKHRGEHFCSYGERRATNEAD